MRSRWSDDEAAGFVGRFGAEWGEALALRTYSARLLGAEPGLVLHGGGNCSVKASWTNVLGEVSDAIFVKAAENDPSKPASHGERFAERYEINMLRCIFCGMCEEACPEDAIYLEKDYELSDYNRDAFIYTKQELLVPEEKSGYLPAR